MITIFLAEYQGSEEDTLGKLLCVEFRENSLIVGVRVHNESRLLLS